MSKISPERKARVVERFAVLGTAEAVRLELGMGHNTVRSILAEAGIARRTGRPSAHRAPQPRTAPQMQPAVLPAPDRAVAKATPSQAPAGNQIAALIQHLEGYESDLFAEADRVGRVIKQVKIDEAVEADKVFDMLMGSDVAPRKSFIQTHAKMAELDI